MPPEDDTKGGATRLRPKISAFRFSEETHTNLDLLVKSYSPDPEMPVTRTAVVEQAIREMTERRTKRKRTER